MIIGIDTSNYKTSVAVTDREDHIVFERSEYLHVDKGKRGLRQSEAFFMHSNRLPDQINDLFSHAEPEAIEAIGVSTRPRRVEGSYMPCFLAGINAAKEIAAALKIPVYEFSHQEGHAAAVIVSCSEDSSPAEADDGCSCLLFHLSGGTTEFLLCTPDEKGYNLEIIGGTKDISAGQLIDRAGVAMGFGFPSGLYLDRLAADYCGSVKTADTIKPVRIKDGWFNLSGTEAQMLRALDSDDPDHAALSYVLFDCIASLLARSAAELTAQYGVKRVYMAGGVASSAFIRKRIHKHLASNGASHREIIFGEPALSGDNAVGTAFLAARQHYKNIQQ
ncbi:MAG: peptidase M22 [Mogibacterium sp.]|nr:peptidase M22 [Mogibacterium sp.]